MHHGQANQSQRGSVGVGIVLSAQGQCAWEAAGKPKPVCGPLIDDVACIMGVHLTFLDRGRREKQFFVISAYHVDSGRSLEEHDTFLQAFTD
eukprot:1339434-Ditylum_brightwellii.AAC.1